MTLSLEEQIATQESETHTQPSPVSVIIPAYNEEQSVREQVESVRRALEERQIVHEIIVVDDGSQDNTAHEAQRAQALIIKHPVNRGYGAALKTGIHHAQYDTIAIIDGDGSYPAQELPAMLAAAEHYDMVVGSRTGPSVQVPFFRRPAKWFLRRLASYLAEQPIPDLNSGLRVLKKPIVEKFEYLLPAGFSFTTTITLAFLCNDYLVHYHPIDYYPRVGQSKIRPIDSYHFLLLILRTIVYFNPIRVFLPLGGVLFLMGTAKFVYDLFLENLSESAIFGFLGAFIIWAIGLLADQISKIGLGLHSK